MTRKCQHPACRCDAPEGQRHCSVECERSAGDEKRCDCGHADCD